MTIRRYYELSLFVPLAVPLLMALLGFSFGSEPGPSVPEVGGMVAGVGVVAFVVAGACVALVDGVLYLLYHAGLVRRETAIEV